MLLNEGEDLLQAQSIVLRNVNVINLLVPNPLLLSIHDVFEMANQKLDDKK